MVEVRVNPGICGFKSVIRAHSEDMMTSKIVIESDCQAVAKLSKNVTSVEVLKDIFGPFGSSSVYTEAASTLTHAACPVPSAILKAVEVSCGLALPADVTFEISKE
jgi:hypothetical protein